MSGGPSQMETFDPHQGHENGGPTKAIETSVPGIRIAEHLPKLAGQMQDLAVIRSMTSKVNEHAQGNYFMHTGFPFMGHPSAGA